MNHLCHAVDCEIPVPPRMLMCRTHWGALPAPAKRIIWHYYRPGQEVRKDPSREYMLAHRIAVLLVAFHERTWSAPQALNALADACLAARADGISAADIEMTARAMGCEAIH
jgi:hypothetical protein